MNTIKLLENTVINLDQSMVNVNHLADMIINNYDEHYLYFDKLSENYKDGPFYMEINKKFIVCDIGQRSDGKYVLREYKIYDNEKDAINHYLKILAEIESNII